MNEQGILFHLLKDVNTHNFFKFKSTDINTLLSGLFVGQNGRFGVMVRSPVNQTPGEGSIQKSEIWVDILQFFLRIVRITFFIFIIMPLISFHILYPNETSTKIKKIREGLDFQF